MFDSTKEKLTKVLKKCKANQTQTIKTIEMFDKSLDDEDILDCVEAINKAEIYSLLYLNAILKNKVEQLIIKVKKERKQYGTPPKDNI